MKTNIRFIALIIAITATSVTQTVRAQAQTLVITENSSTSLTAILNGTTSLSVTPGSLPDTWHFAMPGVLGGPGAQAWMEPGAAGFINDVFIDRSVSTQLDVQSDFPGVNALADGTPDTSSFTLNGAALTVTFFDKGDAASTPETGSTLGLLALALAALFGASRFRAIRLA